MRDFNQIATFAEVARQGSFAAAARALGAPTSTVSARVMALEDDLGVRLLKRTTRRLSLTDDGQLLYAQVAEAVATLAGCDQILPRGSTELTGRLKLTAPPEYPLHVLSQAIRTFRTEHPSIAVNLNLTNRVLDFVDDGIDLAIRGRVAGTAGMVSSRLPSITFGLYASPGYMADRSCPETPSDLAAHQILLLETTGDPRPQMFPDLLVSRRQADRAIAANTMTLLKQLVLDGHGVAVLPRHLCISEVQTRKLVNLVPEWTGGEAGAVHLVYLSRRDATTRVKMLADHIRRAAHEVYGIKPYDHNPNDRSQPA